MIIPSFEWSYLSWSCLANYLLFDLIFYFSHQILPIVTDWDNFCASHLFQASLTLQVYPWIKTFSPISTFVGHFCEINYQRALQSLVSNCLLCLLKPTILFSNEFSRCFTSIIYLKCLRLVDRFLSLLWLLNHFPALFDF